MRVPICFSLGVAKAGEEEEMGNNLMCFFEVFLCRAELPVFLEVLMVNLYVLEGLFQVALFRALGLFDLLLIALQVVLVVFKLDFIGGVGKGRCLGKVH